MKCPLKILVALTMMWNAAAYAQDDPASLWSDATLYRDDFGTPHIYAQTPRALGFAFGYAQAEDHLEAMLMAYRTANGRAAEVAGEKMAASDEFALHMGHARLAEYALAHADGGTVELCTGFAMGVNAYLLEHQDNAPPWAEGVKPQDPIALWHAFVTSMAPLDLPGVSRPPRAEESGNAWALAPSRTEDGRALLVINPHHYFDGAFRWYEAHLSLGGMNIAGATLFGLPLILQGHNEALGWALTPNLADFADVFQEDPKMPVSRPKEFYQRMDEDLLQAAPMLEYLSHAQPYYVRTDEGMKERAAPGMIGTRGPIFDSGGAFYSWTIGGFADIGAFAQFIAMANAHDLGAFQDALAMQQIPCFNVVYADREGNVFYLYNAKAGTREVEEQPQARRDGEPTPQAPNWSKPLASNFFNAAWANVLPMSVLPSVLNPATGYVQACGGPPWACTDDAPLDPTAFPEWFIGETDTFRARRVRQLLRTGTRSFRDMQAMLYDTVVPAASEMTPILLGMADAEQKRVAASHPDLQTGLQALRDWNYTADNDATGMTFYHVWWNLLSAKYAAQFANESEMYDALATKDAAAQDAALGAATDAARLMRNDMNSVQIPWGDAHRITRGSRDFAMPGAGTGEPIFVSGDYAYAAGKWHASYGYGVAMVVAFGDTPETVSVSTFGASENPASPHYADQLDLLLNKRFKRNYFLESDVLRYAESAFGRNVTLYPVGAVGQVTFSCTQAAECRLNVVTDAPAPLPEGLTAFTAYVQPTVKVPGALSELALSLAVPAELCTEEALPSVVLYQLVAGRWSPAEGQTRDTTGRVLSAALPQTGTFAILGPQAALLKATPTVPGEKEAADKAAAEKSAGEAAAPETKPAAPETAPGGESAVEKQGRGYKLKLKGEYVSEAARAPKPPIEESGRGVRVIRLRGGEQPEDSFAAGTATKKGHALWLEGVPGAISIDPQTGEPVVGAAQPGGNPYVAPAVPAGGAKELRLRGGYTAGIDTATDVAVPAPQTQGLQTPDAQTPLPGALPNPAAPPAATPGISPEGGALPGMPQPTQTAPAEAAQEPEAAPAKDAKKLSRKEKKRLKQEEEAARENQVQSFQLTPGGIQAQQQPGNAPPDSFGDTPPAGKKRKR